MTCRELIDFLGDFFSDELPADTLMEFERHLSVCRHCRDYLASYRATIAIGRAALRASDDVVPAEVPEGLVQAILLARGAA